MTTSKTFSIRKDLPTVIVAKARGFFDYKEIKVFDGTENSYNITMEEYDNLKYSFIDSSSTPKSCNIEALTLPDYSYVYGEQKVLMPYNNNKIYYNVKYNVINGYFKNNFCTISDTNILSGFSTTNYVQITKAFPDSFSNFKIIFKVTTGNSVTSHHECIFGNTTSTNVSIIIRNTGRFSYYIGSWVEGATTLQANTSYWFGVNYNSGTFTGYLLQDNGNYSLETLPEFSKWTTEWSSTTNIFAGRIFNIGYNRNVPAEFFEGTFDLNNCKIWVNNEDFWYYNMTSVKESEEKGIFYNYTDTGSAVTLNCFYYNNTFILSSNESIENGVYLGQVNVPTHDIYNYSETNYTLYDNFTVIGTLSIDQDTGKVSGFSSNNYIKTQYQPNLPTNLPWRMRARFKFGATGYTQYIFSSNDYRNGPFFGINSNNKLYCGIGSNGNLLGSITSTFTLSIGINYILEWSFDGVSTYTLKYKKEDDSWQTVGTLEITQQIVVLAPFQLGANNNGYLHDGNVLDLSTDTWFEINGNKTWIPTKVHYVGTWTKV